MHHSTACRSRPGLTAMALLVMALVPACHRGAVEAPAPRRSPARDSLLLFDATRPTPAAFQPLGGGISRDATMGFTFGVLARASATTRNLERYLTVWERRRGDPWHIAQSIAISSANAPADLKSPALPPTTAAGATLLHADSAFADAASIFGMARAYGDFFSGEGVIVTPSEIVFGSAAAVDYFGPARNLSSTWTPAYAAIAASGDFGFTTGDAVTTFRGNGGPVTQRFATYLRVWRRDPRGEWKVIADGASARPNPVGRD